MSNLIKQKQVQSLETDLAARALDSAVVKKSNNLSDVNAASARANLALYSQSEVNALVAGAENARSVADGTAKNALTGLKVGDRVFVSNDGDSKWALYIVTAITTGTGSTSTFQKIGDEDIFTNAISASAVKTAYESNSNTNAFTDAEKTKVGHLTVTQAVNLDTMESGLATTTSTANSALSAANAAATAASNAQSTANGAVSDAAAAQLTADGAVSDAAAARATANSAATAAAAAQTTANSATTAAATAQSTADGAVSDAAAAQTTASNAAAAASAAQTTADAKEAIFTHASQEFTGITGNAGAAVNLTLTKPVADGFVPMVFINGLQVKTVTFSAGQAGISYTAPYATDASDEISVAYFWR
jgi:hypothetical protein